MMDSCSLYTFCKLNSWCVFGVTFSASPVLGIASVRDAEETPAQDEDAEDAPLSGMSRTMRSSSKAATAAMIASAMAEEEDQVQ